MNAKKIFSFLFNFNGRMTRKPFWISYLINRAIYVLLAVLFYNTLLEDSPESLLGIQFQSSMTGWIVLLAVPMIIILINGFALISRRFHDTGRSFWGYLGLCCIASVSRIIPLVGLFVALGIIVLIIVLLCLPTDYENDTFGPVTQQQMVMKDSLETVNQSN